MSKARKLFEKEHSTNPYEGRVGLAYIRVSSKNQEISGHGRESQEERCKQDLHSISVPYVRAFPDTFTGAGDFMKRPAMKEMLDYIDANPHQKFVVVFDDLKRFARDVEAHFKLRTAFRLRDVELRCPNYNFDESEEGEFVEHIFAAQAQLERKQNRRQVVQKMKARLELGYWTFGGKKGYEMIKDPVHGKLAVPDGKDSLILKKALEGFASGVYIRKIDACRYLVEKGFWKNQSPEKYIDKFTGFLEDSFYAGFIEYLEWGVLRRKGHHKAIISLDTFEKNQRRLKSEGLHKRIRVDTSDDFPLRGLSVCRECGKPITGAWSKGRTKRYPYYFCQNTLCSQKQKAIPKKEMEDAFSVLLKKQTLKDGINVLLQENFEAAWAEEMKEKEETESGKQKQKMEIEERIKNITGLIIDTKSEVVRRAYEAQLETATLDLEKISSADARKLDMAIPYRTAFEKVTGLLKSPYMYWDSVDTVEKHRLYYFIFEERLAYSKKEGYRTDNLPCAVRLFEEFACANPLDVEMGGIEPPCKKVFYLPDTNIVHFLI